MDANRTNGGAGSGSIGALFNKIKPKEEGDTMHCIVLVSNLCKMFTCVFNTLRDSYYPQDGYLRWGASREAARNFFTKNTPL